MCSAARRAKRLTSAPPGKESAFERIPDAALSSVLAADSRPDSTASSARLPYRFASSCARFAASATVSLLNVEDPKSLIATTSSFARFPTRTRSMNQLQILIRAVQPESAVEHATAEPTRRMAYAEQGSRNEPGPPVRDRRQKSRDCDQQSR